MTPSDAHRPDRAMRLRDAFTLLVVALLYLPIVSVVLASLANTRYLIFPHRVWTIDAYREALAQYTTANLHATSFQIALAVAVVAVAIAVPGALAFARFRWRGRTLYQRALLLPVFFPQPVLGLALLVALSAAGIAPDWRTAVFAHLVWVVPIATLVISIRLYGFDPAQEEAAYDLGASRLQAFREVTLPAMMPGIVSGALFAFLLSWSNLPLSMYTTGADTTLPEWLYSRMATNYSPQVPAIAVLSVGASALAVVAILLVRAAWRAWRRARAPSTAAAPAGVRPSRALP